MNNPRMNSLRRPAVTCKDTIAPPTPHPQHPLVDHPSCPEIRHSGLREYRVREFLSSYPVQESPRKRRGSRKMRSAKTQNTGANLTQPDMNPTFPAMTRLLQTRPDMNRPNPQIHDKRRPKNRVIDLFLRLRGPQRGGRNRKSTPETVKPMQNRTVEFDGTQFKTPDLTRLMPT